MREYFLGEETQFDVDCLKLDLADDYRDLLYKNDLKVLPDFMSVSRDNSFRDVHQRLTVGLDLSDDSSTKRIYLKRHWSDKKGKTDKPHYEARSEAENISLLKDLGFPVPDFVATGWGYLNKRSVAFVAMHEVPGLQGDHFIEKYLAHPQWAQIKNNLIFKLACLAKEFHARGFNHRDFYLCHFFVDLDGLDVHLNIIDLQRVQHRKIFRKRWIVKDLAQMCYSSLKLVSNTDRLKFFLLYMGIESLDAGTKHLIRQILKKTARMVTRGEQGKDR